MAFEGKQSARGKGRSVELYYCTVSAIRGIASYDKGEHVKGITVLIWSIRV